MQAYLKSLSRKPASAEPQWDKFGELSDLSDDGQRPGGAILSAPAGASKFLKKKPAAADTPTAVETRTPQQPSASRSLKTSLPVKSSALSKVNALATRYSAGSYDGSVRKSGLRSSDSESDLGLSMDEDVIADVRALKSGSTTQQSAAGKLPHESCIYSIKYQ